MIIKNIIIRGLQFGLQFIITIFIAWCIGPYNNGIFSLFIAECSIFILLLGFSLESSISHFMAKGKISMNEVPAILKTLLYIQTAAYWILFILYSLSHKHFIISYQNVLFAICGYLFIIGNVLWGYCNAVFNALEKFETLIHKAILLQLLFLLFAVWLKFSSGIEPKLLFKPFIVSYCILFISLGAIGFFYFHKMLSKISWKLDKSIFKNPEIKKYAFIVFACNVIQFLCYRADLWILKLYNKTEDIGQYALSVKVSQLWWILPQLIAMLIFPLTSLEKYSWTQLKKTLQYTLLFGTIAAIIAIVIAPIFFSWFKGYNLSTNALFYLLPGAVVFSINILLAASISGKGKPQINLKASLFCFVVIILLDFILIPTMGINGAALASSIAYICSTTLAIILYKNAN